MADEKVENLDKTVRALRKRIEQVAADQAGHVADLRFAVAATALAAGMLVLTATTWMSGTDPDYDRTYVHTLWALVPEGWPALVTLALVVVAGIGTMGTFLADVTGRVTHIVFVVLALAAAAAVLVLVGWVEPPGTLEPDDYDTAPGRWLTVLAALALAAMHGARAGELRTVSR